MAATLAGAVGCAESYEDIADHCYQELKARPADATGKPKVCEKVKDDDYLLLVVSATAHRKGWLDDDGNVDMGELLKDGEAGN